MPVPVPEAAPEPALARRHRAEPATALPWSPPPRPAPPREAEPHRYRMLQDLALDQAAPEAEASPPPYRPGPRPAMPALKAAYPPEPAAPFDTLSQRPLAGAPLRAPGTPPRGTRPRRAWPR